jgi:protein phosphatase 1 regulatory subunit 37
MIKDYPDTIAPQTSIPSPPGSPMSSTMSFGELAPPYGQTKKVVGVNGSASSTHSTTYTPYIPKSRRPQRLLPIDTSGKSYSLITSSAQGGITTRHSGPSVTLLDNIRALDNLPRLGCLRTLDLRGNDIRVRGVTKQSIRASNISI